VLPNTTARFPMLGVRTITFFSPLPFVPLASAGPLPFSSLGFSLRHRKTTKQAVFLGSAEITFFASRNCSLCAIV